jgi:hypothetical protein
LESIGGDFDLTPPFGLVRGLGFLEAWETCDLLESARFGPGIYRFGLPLLAWDWEFLGFWPSILDFYGEGASPRFDFDGDSGSFYCFFGDSGSFFFFFGELGSIFCFLGESGFFFCFGEESCSFFCF